MKNIVGFGTIVSIKSLPSGSCLYSIDGNLPVEGVFQFLQQPIHYIFQRSEFQPNEVKAIANHFDNSEIKVPRPKIKTKSQQVRNKIYRLWEKAGKPGTSEEYYDSFMDKYLEYLDSQLDEL